MKNKTTALEWVYLILASIFALAMGYTGLLTMQRMIDFPNENRMTASTHVMGEVYAWIML